LQLALSKRNNFYYTENGGLQNQVRQEFTKNEGLLGVDTVLLISL